MRLVILARLLCGIPQSLDLYARLHLSHSPSGRPLLLWMLTSNFIKLQRQYPVVQTAECFPQCLHKAGEWWTVKSHKASPVHDGCAVMACCCNMATKDFSVSFGSLLWLHWYIWPLLLVFKIKWAIESVVGNQKARKGQMVQTPLGAALMPSN